MFWNGAGWSFICFRVIYNVDFSCWAILFHSAVDGVGITRPGSLLFLSPVHSICNHTPSCVPQSTLPVSFIRPYLINQHRPPTADLRPQPGLRDLRQSLHLYFVRPIQGNNTHPAQLALRSCIRRPSVLPCLILFLL